MRCERGASFFFRRNSIPCGRGNPDYLEESVVTGVVTKAGAFDQVLFIKGRGPEAPDYQRLKFERRYRPSRRPKTLAGNQEVMIVRPFGIT